MITRLPRILIPNGPLIDPRFRLLWGGQTLSYAGSAVFPVALTIALIKDNGSATDLGLVAASSMLAEALFFLFGGVWADRLPRQLVMVGADTVRCIAHVLIGLELASGRTDLSHLVIVALVVGTANAFFLPASSGLVPATVAPELLQKANALMGASRHGATLVGPAIATTLALTVGAGWALVLDGITFAVSAITLALLKVPHVKPTVREPFHVELRHGWDEVRKRTWLWSNLVGHGLWNLARTTYFVVAPMVVIANLGGEVAWGTITQGGAVGALVGALIALRVRPRRPLLVANICLAMGALPLPLIALEAPTYVIAVAAGLMSVALGLFGALWSTTLQQHVPDNLISRVSAYDWLVSIALAPLSLALAAPLALRIGSSETLFAAAALMVTSALGSLLVADVRRLPPEPAVVSRKEARA
ncbi:MFS transporter (plasmid) [Streptomyces sp. NBC_00853]|uniref:MFS transporter n=1 Tax=Streptomyces sp. NBC_00853 TaxID=2903681 RepID=UPI002F90D004|nr:MFS transporter [Streptomyces sp. NBC_00853]